jgi:ABC-type nitrate/sulfonate/bicarbonate transport system permease component
LRATNRPDRGSAVTPVPAIGPEPAVDPAPEVTSAPDTTQAPPVAGATGGAGPAGPGRRSLRRDRQRRAVMAGRVLIVVVVLGIMQGVNAWKGDLVMPAPWSVVTSGWDQIADGTLPHALVQSLAVFGIGFAASAVTGILFGVIIGGFKTVERVFDPFINALNATPRVAFIPLIIVWVGLGVEAKIVITWVSAVVPILINAAAGVKEADADLTEMARSLGVRKWTLFSRVLVPGALPSILTGLRIGSALAILGTVVSELYTQQAGLGGLLVNDSNNFEMARYFAVVVVLGALGIVVTALLRAAENYFYRWRVDHREAR